jgi:transposase
MCPEGYYLTMRESKDPRLMRHRMVIEAAKNGIKPTARAYKTTPRTVRTWLERFDGTLASLVDRSRAPLRRPRKLCPEAEAEIVRARKRLPGWGAARLRHIMQLPYSPKAIGRVIREHGLVRRWRRKKHEVKRCLREIKRHLELWQQIVLDTKHLNDLPEYWVQAKTLGLPRYQYTARDVTTGSLFLGFSDELSLTYAQLFAERIAAHLVGQDTDLSKVTWQTDNGTEFVGSWQAAAESAFTKTIESAGSTHRTIPPGQHRFQADVETVHSLMELEFYLERFKNRQDFIAKATTYQHFFNYLRPNSGKEFKCPWELVLEKNSSAKRSTLYLPPVFLEDLLRKKLHPLSGVYDVWNLPSVAGLLPPHNQYLSR